ncbi:hypothetical protein [Fodinibius sediminis]|uniref:Uncharacterized protein n=1 Tax=Fodinibius sediminis TaxID=1214077 RepID=A0A521DTC7_9BACT|nr:hypothetical protein [Fodinibius sediminis]SMO75013.1 hypothetical protein SAMN06265218_111132 [Fodinibius sediminis]
MAVLLSWGTLAMTGCSKSDDQQQFEQEAHRLPENITRTDAAGHIENEVTDPDDWRISPMYQGHISLGSLGEFQPPFPNPVDLNSSLNIQIYQRSPDRFNALHIQKIDSLGNTGSVHYFDSNTINSTFNDLSISGDLIAGGQGSSASGLYRILLYDGRNNLITYGDIRVR